MTLANNRHPNESNGGPLFWCFCFERQVKCAGSPLEHWAMRCRASLGCSWAARSSSESTTCPQHRASVSPLRGLMKLPARPVSGWGRGCGVALNTGGNSPRQGGVGERGRQPCVDQALRVRRDGAAVSKSRGNAGKSKSKQKPFAMSHLSYVANLKSGNSVKC